MSLQNSASDVPPSDAALDAFVGLVGPRLWNDRLLSIARRDGAGPRARRALVQCHAIEMAIERLRAPGRNRPPGEAEQRVAALAADAVRLAGELTPPGRERLRAWLRAALTGDNTLVPVFHQLRTAWLQRSRGFEVSHAGLDEAAPFDLLLRRDGIEAEVACDIMSAEEGRGVHRGAWFHLADRVDPDLQTWLAAHPGRYLLKMTLPRGLKREMESAGGSPLGVLHGRIRTLLTERRRGDHDEAAVLRLDPLLLAAAQADELGLLSRLRAEFGPEAHLSVTASGDAVFVMAARAGQANEIAVAMRRRLVDIAPARLTGTRPGIIAMFIEDVDRGEWRVLRERLEIEAEARQFMTGPQARGVVAVTVASRLELFGLAAPDGVSDGELRFRNPAHPAARTAALAPAVLSSF